MRINQPATFSIEKNDDRQKVNGFIRLVPIPGRVPDRLEDMLKRKYRGYDVYGSGCHKIATFVLVKKGLFAELLPGPKVTKVRHRLVTMDSGAFGIALEVPLNGHVSKLVFMSVKLPWKRHPGERCEKLKEVIDSVNWRVTGSCRNLVLFGGDFSVKGDINLCKPKDFEFGATYRLGVDDSSYPWLTNRIQ